jgi:hypothetical protein
VRGGDEDHRSKRGTISGEATRRGTFSLRGGGVAPARKCAATVAANPGRISQFRCRENCKP